MSIERAQVLYTLALLSKLAIILDIELSLCLNTYFKAQVLVVDSLSNAVA